MSTKTDFLDGIIESADADMRACAERMASGLERAADELRRSFNGAIDSGESTMMVSAIGDVPTIMGRALAGCDGGPLARQLATRIAAERQLAEAASAKVEPELTPRQHRETLTPCGNRGGEQSCAADDPSTCQTHFDIPDYWPADKRPARS